MDVVLASVQARNRRMIYKLMKDAERVPKMYSMRLSDTGVRKEAGLIFLPPLFWSEHPEQHSALLVFNNSPSCSVTPAERLMKSNLDLESMDDDLIGIWITYEPEKKCIDHIEKERR